MSYIPKIVNQAIKNLEIEKVPGTEALFKCESIKKIEKGNGVKPVISFVYFPEGSNKLTEWEVEYGAIQLVTPFDIEKEGHLNMKQHIFMKNVRIDWAQLAVEERGLPEMIFNRDYVGIENVLKDFYE